MPVIADPRDTNPTFPAWLKPDFQPQTQEDFDKEQWRGMLRTVVHATGLDDPASQLLMLMAPMGVPGKVPASKAVAALKERFPRTAKALESKITAYHGSPHDFEKFDTAKIGTGEGAQAYGHGLYFAENPGVAEEYKKQLTASYPKFTHTDSDLVGGIAHDTHDLPVRRAEIILAPTTSKDEALRTIEEGRSYLGEKGYSIAKGWIDSGEVHWPPRAGRTYEVAIKANPDHFLDWDKPLSQQSEVVRKAATKLGVSRPLSDAEIRQAAAHHGGIAWDDRDVVGSLRDQLRAVADELARPSEGQDIDAANKLRLLADDVADIPGSEAYRLVSGQPVFQGPHPYVTATDKWKRAGIPGIKYLDQGSRTTGEGTRNYVVFDAKTIEILRKYGIVLPLAGASAAHEAQK